jgi:uncharacterized protein
MHMSPETGDATVDFFLRQANGYNELSLCFFGGEPLLNPHVMKRMVARAREKSSGMGKSIRFNVTTNGTLLSSPMRDYLRKNEFGVIVSIDGCQDVHDAMRVYRNGRGSYRRVMANIVAGRSEAGHDGPAWTLRSTFSRQHLRLSEHAFHLADTGHTDISVEPCLSTDNDVGLQDEDLATLKSEYLSFAQEYLERLKNGEQFSFFHFRVMLDQTRRGTRRITQCGAGRGYFAVSAGGDLFPCHRLVGKEEFKLGDVRRGIVRKDVRDQFLQCHANTKPLCRDCWARYICGGGCHACAVQFNGDIYQPYELECDLIRHRIEIGAYLYSELCDHQRGSVTALHGEARTRHPYLSEDVAGGDHVR